jgi:hypothetical protein
MDECHIQDKDSRTINLDDTKMGVTSIETTMINICLIFLKYMCLRTMQRFKKNIIWIGQN